VAAIDPEQYASRVEAELVRLLRSSDERVLSSMPSPQDAAQLIMDTEPAPGDSPLADRIGAVWSSAGTRERLGLGTRQALNSRRLHGTILGIKTREGGVFYPVFQFRRRGGHVEVHPNLVPVLKTLKDIDSWTIAAMLQSKDPDLKMSPVQWANSGGDQTLLEEWAETVKRELASQ